MRRCHHRVSPVPSRSRIAERLAAILSGAGLTDVSVRELPVPLRAGSFEEWWNRTVALAGPLAKILQSLSAAAVEEIQARLRDAIRPYQTAGGLELPGLTLIATGQRE